jgi:hypothetical protein
LTLKNDEEIHEMVAISTGGGMIEIVEIDHLKVSMVGDYYVYRKHYLIKIFLSMREWKLVLLK